MGANDASPGAVYTWHLMRDPLLDAQMPGTLLQKWQRSGCRLGAYDAIPLNKNMSRHASEWAIEDSRVYFGPTAMRERRH